MQSITIAFLPRGFFLTKYNFLTHVVCTNKIHKDDNIVAW